MRQDHYVTDLLSYANNVLWCRHREIERGQVQVIYKKMCRLFFHSSTWRRFFSWIWSVPSFPSIWTFYSMEKTKNDGYFSYVVLGLMLLLECLRGVLSWQHISNYKTNKTVARSICWCAYICVSNSVVVWWVEGVVIHNLVTECCLFFQ